MDNKSTFSRLVAFVNQQVGPFKEGKLTRDTKIEADLRLTGDDAEEFMIAFCKEFDVDASGFILSNYFDEEGFMLHLKHLYKLIKGEKIPKKIPLTLCDLEKCIDTKKLL